MKKSSVKLFFISLFLLSVAVDLVSTFWDKRMLIFESNPIYPNTILMVSIKIISSFAFAFMFFRAYQSTQFIQYFWTLIIVLLTVAQIFVGYSNYKLIKHFSDVPTQELEKYVIPKEQLTPIYIEKRINDLYLPIILSLFTFKVWEWSFKDGK